MDLPTYLKILTDLVEQKVEGFTAGDEELRVAGLEAAKFIFDNALKSEPTAYPAIESLLRSTVQTTQELLSPTPPSPSVAGKKRKRSPSPLPTKLDSGIQPTPLSELFIQGMDEHQVWEQLELRARRVCAMASGLLETSNGMDLTGEDEGINASDMMDLLDDDDMEEEMEDNDEDDDDDDDDMDSNEDPSLTEDETEEEEESEEGGDPEAGYGQEGVEDLRDEKDEDEEDDDDLSAPHPNLNAPGSLSRKPSLRKRPKHPTLDDDFFSIDDFNRETEAMEARTRSAGRLGDDEEEEMDEDLDLFAAVEDDPEEEGEPAYQDFFAPVRAQKPTSKPRRPDPSASGSADDEGKGGVRFNESVRVKTIKPKRVIPKKRRLKLDFDPSEYPFLGDDIDEDGMELEDDEESEENDDGAEEMEGIDDFDEQFGDQEGEEEEEEEEADDGAETITRLKNDLFEDDEVDASSANLSTHEKRLAALSEQISALEAENVAKKDWTLMGEAGARTRPVNSLLEEDLDFEHTGRQVPVVTEETTHTLEELIKKRILDNRFDDVVRKRPVDDKPFLPSRMFELQDTKSQKSLAQIYEDDYTAATTGDKSVVDDRDGKLKKEHDEIEKMWEGIAYKLDALSNAHFTPKAPKATIETVSNLPSISMESAMPTTNSTATMLAPEEVFSTSKDALVSKTEMTPEEKKAERRKQKTAFKHDHERLGQAVQSFGGVKTVKGAVGAKKGKKGVRGEKEEALKKVVKEGRGVTVIGKEGKGKGKEKAVPRASLLKL
ncbi:Mpp10 protein [Dacryopinax primogenitus]|uniref:U3 small nucleolar ribonucleoprotein protein MPP10 n=1 Tax=Dacryopinax primogenitus (strain DJM 731) TaxID=1858805 RepID=M5G4E1_DACPD|nr:Mpp10 protein [Dacryopinax primogenitus]EJU03100.1 Mpp10 protein [Dacryopinax primogenitus]